jgi:hypothetical protein
MEMDFWVEFCDSRSRDLSANFQPLRILFIFRPWVIWSVVAIMRRKNKSKEILRIASYFNESQTMRPGLKFVI